jgi:hypothetical protein
MGSAREIVMSTFRYGLIGAALAAALLAATPPSFAQGTAEQRSACMGDAFKFCSAEIPNIPKITACMIKRKADLSSGCRAVMDRDLAAQKGKLAAK